MPMMDIAELKPASYAVQAAKQAWYAAVAVMADHDHKDIQGLGLVAERAEAAQKVYINLACALANEVRILIAVAER